MTGIPEKSKLTLKLAFYMLYRFQHYMLQFVRNFTGWNASFSDYGKCSRHGKIMSVTRRMQNIG